MNSIIDPTAVIDPSVEIGEGCRIGRQVVISAGVTLEPEVTIEDFSIIGYGQLTHARHKVNSRVVIGRGALIRTHCVIYQGCQIGAKTMIGHHVGLREETIIGACSTIGSGCWCEGYTTVGDYTTIHAQCHLTARMTVGDYVFIGPQITTANARHITFRRTALSGQRTELGPTIKFGARIGSQVMLLPGVTIGRESLVAAGSNVTKDVADYMIVRGNPAREVQPTKENERLVPGIDFDPAYYGQPEGGSA